MSLYKILMLKNSWFRSLPFRALLRIWPLLLTMPLHHQAAEDPQKRIAVLGLSCLVGAIGLLYFLMTQDEEHQQKSTRPKMGRIPSGPSLVRLARLRPTSSLPWPLLIARFGGTAIKKA